MLRKGRQMKTLSSVPVHSRHHLMAAKQLHVDVYLDRGFIRPHDIGFEGTLTLDADPHQAHSKYFVVRPAGEQKEGILAAARQIQLDPSRGLHSYPILQHASIWDSGRDLIARYDPARCVEISALVKRRGATSWAPLLLYRSMWQHSVKHRHQLWMMACDVRLFPRLRQLFGEAIIQIGDQTPYYGGDVIPAALQIQGSISAMLDEFEKITPIKRGYRKHILRFYLKGLPISSITESNQQRLKKHGII